MNNLYGATHYSTMRDGITPQMYYKKLPIQYNDNTSKHVWHYLSYANIWIGSNIKVDSFEESRLVPIIKAEIKT